MSKKVKKQISVKLIGRNVIVVLSNGEKLSAPFKEKTDRLYVKSLVEEYNARNSAAKEKKIVKLMLDAKTPTTKKSKVEKNTPSKTKKVKVDPEVKEKASRTRKSIPKKQPKIGRRKEY